VGVFIVSSRNAKPRRVRCTGGAVEIWVNN
jgi:hypothetical protein